jgi:hypothetical protein
MPPIRTWFVGLRAFIVAFAGVLLAQLTQLSGTETKIALTSWLVALLTAATAAANAMHDAWPDTPPTAPVAAPPDARHPRDPTP